MNLFKNKNIVFILLLLISYCVSAQFSITESFKNALPVNTNVILGGKTATTKAIVTSGNGDPVGDGWLRLTKNETNQAGFAYINQSFSSTQGVLVEFDYKTWGNENGADGFVFYLFDALYGPTGSNVLKVGAYGGSLGYANNATEKGLTGGYIGVGFDEFGNYSKNSEGKNGGVSGTTSNFVSIRGNATNTYKYFAGNLYNLGTGVGQGISYSKAQITRPTDDEFYRRVRLVITPVSGKYNIKVFIKNKITDQFPATAFLDFTSTETPPANLKLGFAASTGGSKNYHEVRNVIATTPGGLRVSKTANKTVVSSFSDIVSNQITYTIKVSNDSEKNLNTINFEDVLKDVNGVQLSTSQFRIDDFVLSGFVDNTKTILTNNANKLTGVLKVNPFSEGTITLTGTYLGNISNNKFTNTVSVSVPPSDLIDNDLTNNTATVTTEILEAIDDIYKWGSNNMVIMMNDKLDSKNTSIILSGSKPNTTISTVGTWPIGITLNTTTGEVKVVTGTLMPTIPLKYKICSKDSNTCSEANILFYDQENDISITSAVSNQCGYNGNTNNYTLTVKNNLPFPITTSSAEKISLSFKISNGVGNSAIETFSTTLGQNSNWNIAETGGLLSPSYDYVFTLKDNVTIPANGTITLQFAKNWNIALDLENSINSLNITLSYKNASGANLDGNLSNNTNYVSVFRTSSTSVPSVSNKKVDQHHVITVGEAANLGPNTNGYKFYLADGVTEIPSNYLIPTATLQPFSFRYRSDCSGSQMTVSVEVGFPNPGSISLVNGSLVDSILTCYDDSVTVYERIPASLNGALFNYYWELSYDGGVTWLKESTAAGDDGSSSSSNGRQSITINNIKKQIKVRRYAKPLLVNSVAAYSNEITINVQENKISFPNNISSFVIAVGSSFTLPNVTTSLVSDVKITNKKGDPVSGTILNTELPKGEHIFTVEAKTTNANGQKADCTTLESIKVIVYDLADCDTTTKKVFASHQQKWSSGLSDVANPGYAVSGDRSRHATITGGVVLLGIGTVGIDLYFTKPDGTLYSGSELKGKKITIKLGEQYSGLKVAGGLTVVGRNVSSLSSVAGAVPPIGNVGATFGVKGGVLDALKGDNVFSYSFVPSETNGKAVEYNGVRIQLGSLIGVADLATVFYAYIEENVPNNRSLSLPLIEEIKVSPLSSLLYPITQKDVDGTMLTGIANTNIKLNNFVDDATWGNRSEVVNLASSLASIIHPYYSIDDNYDSYTLFNATAGVLNQQFLRTHLRKIARPGDQVRITLAYPNLNVLNLSLLQLGNFKIVYYLGDTRVGEEEMEKFRVLDIGLFNFRHKRRAVISKPVTIPFDSFEIQQFSTVNVNLGDGLHVHDIRVEPMMLFTGQTDPKEVTYICAADFLAIQSPDYCTDYEVSFAKVIEFGEEYINADGTPMLDKDGNPVRSILQVEDIPNSTLVQNHFDATSRYYRIDRLYKDEENEGIILVKIQTKRQGTDYGDPQYLRVKLTNCIDGIVNPIIKSGVK